MMNIFKKVFLIIIFTVITYSAAPAQTYTDFTTNDLAGNPVTLDSLLQKGPVFLSFWATWCSPCKEEMKYMQPIYDKYKDQGFTYLAVNQDNQKSVSKVNPYITSHNYTFPVVLDLDKKIFEYYNGSELPYALLINSKHEIVSVHTGYLSGDDKKIEDEIQSVLAKK